VRPSRIVEIPVVQSVALLGIHLSGEVCKLILFTHVLEDDNVFGIKRYVPAEASLVEQVLPDAYYSDNSVITAFVEEIAHVHGIGLF
jgi:hypothetical protein